MLRDGFGRMASASQERQAAVFSTIGYESMQGQVAGEEYDAV